MAVIGFHAYWFAILGSYVKSIYVANKAAGCINSTESFISRTLLYTIVADPVIWYLFQLATLLWVDRKFSCHNEPDAELI
jgi:hypothetical protein